MAPARQQAMRAFKRFYLAVRSIGLNNDLFEWIGNGVLTALAKQVFIVEFAMGRPTRAGSVEGAAS